MGQLFGRVLRPQTHRGTCGAVHFFINSARLVKNGLVMAKRRMPLYGIIGFGIFRDFLAHKLAKYQYF